MKKIIPLLAAVCIYSLVTAQQPQPLFVNNPYPKTVSVTGSAEMEIVPDEIYVNIELREYQRKGDPKKDIETIKAEFLGYCKAANIPDSAISIASYSGYNNYYNFRRRKNTDMYASITYQVKFRNSKTMDDLVDKLDDKATESFVVAATSHSKITEFRKQLKIKAIQAAKEKGIYLTEAIGEKLGETISIKEPEEIIPFNTLQASNTNYFNQSLSFENVKYDNGKIVNEADFRKIKLKFEVEVVFALK